ncbi:MAG: ABC transporter permease [Acidobacteriota bacterium]|jgi:ABC-2 type transport system permease protein
MRADKVKVLVKREYVSRIKTKGFWLSTILVPALFAGLALLPALVMSKTTTDHAIVVVDETGRIAEPLAERLGGSADGEVKQVRFDVRVEEPAATPSARQDQRAELERRVLAEEIDSWLWISPESLEENRVEYHAESVSNFLTQEVLEDALSAEIRRQRLAEAGIDPDRVAELTRSIGLETVKVTEKGARAEAGFAGVALAYVLFLLLYMIIIIYGQQVMNGVLEEKTSRAVEVVISSVRPFELMIGKLVGIGLVGLTQLTIWLGTIAVLTAPAVVSAMAYLPPDLSIPSLGLGLAVHFGICFLLGYFLYASFYAAIGSAFNNVQEAQQLASIAVVFLVAPLVLFMPVVNDPNAPWAVVASLIPLFTPLLMMLRIAVQSPPVWQIALGYGLTVLFVGFMIWLTSRIYRVGILMVGKKPTIQEIWRWVRYS